MRGLFSSLVLLLQAASALAVPFSTTDSDIDMLSVRDVELESRGGYRGGHKGGNHTVRCRSAKNRACWKEGFDINTDYETHVPYTGRTRRVS